MLGIVLTVGNKKDRRSFTTTPFKEATVSNKKPYFGLKSYNDKAIIHVYCDWG